jgi:sugar O-acyltransferase (sialic acid O-acetyltransferase NeuD family)
MKKIIIAGNAITASILQRYLSQDVRYEVVATVVDDEFLASGECLDVPSIGMSEIANHFPPDNHAVIMAAGYNDLNKVRESLFRRLKGLDYSIETYIHPDARVYTQHPLGEGCVILPGAAVEPYALVGANTMVWCNVTLAHHSQVAENCWVASGTVISGQAQVGRNTFIGVNATVVNKIAVGEFNVIGGGALITKSTKASSVHLARSAEVFRCSAEEYVKYFGV